jgi:hypothetical protein
MSDLQSSAVAGCQDLVSRLLNPTVAQRIRMRELMSHPWLNEEYIPLQAWGLKAKIRPDDIQQTPVDFMVFYLHLQEADIRDAVINCKPNSMTGTYYLLCERLNKGIPLPDENVMAQGQRKDVVDEMKRHHHAQPAAKQNGEVPTKALTQDAGQTPRFPAISHRESSRHRHSSRIHNVPLSAKKRSHSHEVLSSLQQGLNAVRLDHDNKENNQLILQDLDHIIKDLGGETDSNATQTPRDAYSDCLKILGTNGTSGRKSRSRPPNRGILKREKATSLPDSLNNMPEQKTLFNQRSDMESPGSNKSVRFQSSAVLNRKGSDASSQVSSVSGRHSTERRSMGAHSHHYNARLQAEMEALNRLEPLDRTSSLQCLPVHRQDSVSSVDRQSLASTQVSGTSGYISKKREYSSVQDVRANSRDPHHSYGVERSYSRSSHGRTPRERTSSGERSAQSRVTDRTTPERTYDKPLASSRSRHRSDRETVSSEQKVYDHHEDNHGAVNHTNHTTHANQTSHANHTPHTSHQDRTTVIMDLKRAERGYEVTANQPMGSRSSTMPDLRPGTQVGVKKVGTIGGDRSKMEASGGRRSRRRDSRASDRGKEYEFIPQQGVFYPSILHTPIHRVPIPHDYIG